MEKKNILKGLKTKVKQTKNIGMLVTGGASTAALTTYLNQLPQAAAEMIYKEVGEDGAVTIIRSNNGTCSIVQHGLFGKVEYPLWYDIGGWMCKYMYPDKPVVDLGGQYAQPIIDKVVGTTPERAAQLKAEAAAKAAQHISEGKNLSIHLTEKLGISDSVNVVTGHASNAFNKAAAHGTAVVKKTAALMNGVPQAFADTGQQAADPGNPLWSLMNEPIVLGIVSAVTATAVGLTWYLTRPKEKPAQAPSPSR